MVLPESKLELKKQFQLKKGHLSPLDHFKYMKRHLSEMELPWRSSEDLPF